MREFTKTHPFTACLTLLFAAVTSFSRPALATPGSQKSQAAPQTGSAPTAPTANAFGVPFLGTRSLVHPDEKHFATLRQLTFGGENAEAYFSFDGKQLSLQATTAADRCDQIYTLDLHADLKEAAPSAPGRAALRPVSKGLGRHTCSYFFPSGDRLLFSSTRHLGDACPPPVDRSQGYVWPLYNYQIYSARPDGSDLKRLTETAGYEAESTICHDGSVIFTSDRDGDLELYRMNLDGSGVKRITFAPGYDGGAFFSADCQHIVWRAARPKNGAEQAEMRALLQKHLVRPTRMELWIARADGSEAHPVTELGAASFAPYFFPPTIAGTADRRIIFSSNYGDPKGREFDIYAINSDGTELERITFQSDFDGFPIFSPDGKRLAFSSNRGGKAHGETNVFIAEWRPGPAQPKARIQTSADEIKERITWLTAAERQGRGVGTAGLAAAADKLADWMKAAGLEPGGERGFFQDIEVFVGVRDAGSILRLERPAVQNLLPSQATPAAMSGNGRFSGPLLFAGYGITAPEASWDDLADLDVKGRIAVVLRGVPAHRFSGSAARSYSDLRYKAWNLREHGAGAVVFVDATQDGVPKLLLDGPEGGAGLPVLFLSRAILASLMPSAPSPAAAMMALEQAASEHKLASVSIKEKLSGEIKLTREAKKERNVIGLLRGTSSALAQAAPLPAIVLGAHYDHLGLGGRNSLAPGQHVIHPGADDNASGTAALLAAATALKRSTPPLLADVYFVAFTGEEVGLVGSSRFVEKLPSALRKERLLAMLNFDMVGRLGSPPGGEKTLPVLVVQGSDSAAEWADLVSPLCQEQGLSCKLGGDGYGPSDMTPFYAAGVPVLFFFTGAHADYHRPSDTADKINAMGIVKVSELAAATVREVSSRLQKNPSGLTWKKPSGPPPRAGDRGYGAYLGTIPDYTAMQGQNGGVKLTGTRPRSPAELAGVKPGDVLIGLGESKIDTLEDMSFALKKYKPGQEVDVVVLRNGQRVALKALLQKRPSE